MHTFQLKISRSILWHALDQSSSIVVNYLCRLNNGQHILKCNNIGMNAYQNLIHSCLDYVKVQPVFYSYWTYQSTEYEGAVFRLHFEISSLPHSLSLTYTWASGGEA